MVDFETKNIIWDRYTQCNDSDCRSSTVDMVYVQSSNKVYMLTVYDSNDLHILLLTIDASDGTYASNPYVWNSSCTTVDWILYNDNKLYCQVICNSVSILTVFDTSTETFTSYEFNSSISNKAAIINPVTNSLVIIGSFVDSKRYMYYISTHESSIIEHPDISISSISVITTSDYASVDGSFSLTDMGSFTFTSITPSSSNTQISIEVSHGYTSDVVYYDTATTITVNTLTNFESTINTV